MVLVQFPESLSKVCCCLDVFWLGSELVGVLVAGFVGDADCWLMLVGNWVG